MMTLNEIVLMSGVFIQTFIGLYWVNKYQKDIKKIKG